MNKKQFIPLYSGAVPERVASDLEPLVDFQDQGLSLETLEKLLKEHLVPHLMRYDQPGFQSMFNAFPEEGAELGGRIALAYNQGVTNWQISPGRAMLEELCCKALCRLFGLSPESDATFMYCGTYANQEALYLALHKMAEKRGFDFAQRGLRGFDDPSRLVVLNSVDAHFSIKHAVRILGFGEENLTALAVDKNRREGLILIGDSTPIRSYCSSKGIKQKDGSWIFTDPSVSFGRPHHKDKYPIGHKAHSLITITGIPMVSIVKYP